MIIFFVKLFVIAGLFRYFKIFDIQSFFVYIFGASLIYSHFVTIQNIPEMLLFFTGFFYIVSILIISIKENWRNFFKISFNGITNYLRIFSIGFVLSFVFFPLFLFFKMPVIVFFAILIVHFLIDRLKTLSIFNRRPLNFFNYYVYLGLLFFELLILGRTDLILYFTYFGIFYVILSIVYSVIFSCFTKEVPVIKLTEGMLPAEQIIKIGKEYIKSKPFYLSPQYYLRSKILKKIKKGKDVIKPTCVLSKGDIKMIKNISKAYDFKTFRVQRRIDMRVFIIAGIISTIIYIL